MSDNTVTTWLPNNHDKTIYLTERAVTHIRKMLTNEQGDTVYFGVKKSGCSGFAYIVDIVKSRKPEDPVFVIEGLTVAVDVKSWPYVAGTTIDYVREGLNSHFKFINPNEKGSCGCGESFTI